MHHHLYISPARHAWVVTSLLWAIATLVIIGAFLVGDKNESDYTAPSPVVETLTLESAQFVAWPRLIAGQVTAQRESILFP